MVSLALGIAVIVVVGLIAVWAIRKFVTDARLAYLLHILVVLICAGAIWVRACPVLGVCF
jgi:hypothetical protein